MLLYVVLAATTYYNYKRPVIFFGYSLPFSFGIWEWLFVGPVILLVSGIGFSLVGVALLSPFVLYYFGLEWLALFCLIAFGFLTQYTSLFKLNVNGVSLKFGFPLDIPIGLITFWVFGAFYLVIGVLLISPVLLLIYL